MGYRRYSRRSAQFCGGILVKVQAMQGDTLDLLCQRHYGTTQGVT
ncbi:tail protein X, partial [Serratia nevei]